MSIRVRVLGLVLGLSCFIPWTADAAGKTRTAKASTLKTSLPDAQQNQKLSSLVKRVRSLAGAGKKPLIVFDIDDTILRQPGNRAVPGIADYVEALHSAGGHLVYLTGRKVADESKTIKSLTKAGVRLGERVELLLNPSSKKTLLWKESATLGLKKRGLTIAAFENEFQNTRMFRRVLPTTAEVFHLNTVSKGGDPGGSGKIWVIDDYRY